MTNEFYCYCDIPAPPSWLIADVKKSVMHGFKYNQGLQFTSRPMTEQNRQELDAHKSEFTLLGNRYTRAVYRRYNISPESEAWIKENIGEYSQAGSQLMINGQAFTPHTDGGPRRYILNYLIQTGGADVKTQFFKEPNHDVVREGDPLQLALGDDLELVESVTAPAGTWMALFGKVLHSVVGLETSRVHLSVSFSAEEFAKLKERYSLGLKFYG